jgi:predicted DsbA family dithiol-disulfide isomerase
MIDPSIANIAGRKESDAAATLQVDVIADLICPWCYLGKRRLDSALASVHGPSVVTWFPFQLNPGMPSEGMPFDDYLATKFGDPETVRPGLDYLTEAGRAEGIEFNFDKMKRVPRTLDAHQIMSLADGASADTSQLAEKILGAFFEEGLDIADREVLTALGTECGLSASDISRTLDEDRTRQKVISMESQVRKGGVTGVPDFLVNRRLLIMGAQKSEILLDVFDRAMFGEESDQPVSPTIN